MFVFVLSSTPDFGVSYTKRAGFPKLKVSLNASLFYNPGFFYTTDAPLAFT